MFRDNHIEMPLIEIGYSTREMVFVINRDAVELMSATNTKKMYAMLETAKAECIEIKSDKKKSKKTKIKTVKLEKRLELLSCLSEYKFKEALIVFKINLIHRYLDDKASIGINNGVIKQFSRYAKQYGYVIPLNDDDPWYDIIDPLQEYIVEISTLFNIKWTNINHIFKKDYFRYMYSFYGKDTYRTAQAIECSLPTLIKYVGESKKTKELR